MKKFAVSILAVLYLGLSSGATIHFHYCMGRLIGSSLVNNSAASDKCNKCGMPKKENGKSCCKDEFRNLKIEKDQNVNTGNIQSIKLAKTAVVSKFIEYTPLSKHSLSNFINISSNAPPEKSNVPVYLRNRVFRI